MPKAERAGFQILMGRFVRTTAGGHRLDRTARYLPSGPCYAGISEGDFESLSSILGEKAAREAIDKSPLRRIDLSPFVMDVYPVTRREFLDFIWRISTLPMADSRKVDIGYWRKFDIARPYPDDAPIVSVSVNEARLFAWFHGGRLPTEEEWELAVRGQKLKEFGPLLCDQSLVFPCNWHLAEWRPSLSR